METLWWFVMGEPTKAGRPRHLDERLRQRAKKPEDHSEDNRTRLLLARQHKLQQQLNRVREVTARNKEELLRQTQLANETHQQRLEAARLSREHQLNVQAQRCSSKVERAKQVSRQNRFKRDVESMRKRDEAFRRQSLSNERRHEQLRNRINGTGAVSSPRRNQYFKRQAAIKIQSWWRMHHFGPVVKEFLAINLTLANLKAHTFDTLSRQLKSKKTIQCTRQLLEHILRSSGKSMLEGKPANLERVFLCAYIMVAAPETVFADQEGEMEKILMQCATIMLQQFQLWLESYYTARARETFERFLSAWGHYRQNFEDWKRHDAKKLQELFVAHYIELQVLKETVAGNEVVEREWFPNIEAQQQQLAMTLSRLGGQQALKQLHAALANERRRASIQARRASRESRTSTSSTPTSESNDDFKLLAEPANIQPPKNSPAPQPQPQTVPVQAPTKAPWRPSNYVAQLQLSNEKLVHELSLDPTYQISVKETEEDAGERREFWERLRVKIGSEGMGSEEMVVVIDDVRAALMDCCLNSDSLRADVAAVLDRDYVCHQLQHGVFDLGRCVGYVLTRMQQLCAPVRDDNVQRLKTVTDTVDLLMSIYDTLALMKLDLANFQLQTVAPFFTEHGARYEREKAQGRLGLTADNTAQKLVRTHMWLETSKKGVRQYVQGPSSHRDIVHFGLCDLVVRHPSTDISVIPETLCLDAGRLATYRTKVQSTVCTAVTVMVTGSYIPALRDNSGFVAEMVKKVQILLDDPKPKMDDMGKAVSLAVGLVVNKYLRLVGMRPLDASHEALLASVVEKTYSPSDPFHKLVQQRILEALFHGLRTGALCTHMLSRSGLTVFQSSLNGLAVDLHRLAKHHLDVYGPHYDRMLSQQQAP